MVASISCIETKKDQIGQMVTSGLNWSLKLPMD
jgi:hypothetical protein